MWPSKLHEFWLNRMRKIQWAIWYLFASKANLHCLHKTRWNISRVGQEDVSK